ncbi:class I adenylate-forming enzyme family protein [Streptomyces clavuligerus]|uniref:AMP-dependent synthetase and ligase n=1 Tax=Streptomyces clavuligerus TaxID=1901 RepID=E2Q9D8_STRCL|nr:AMP-binding protein [Streptomyces clavuligerus]ANW21318.1 peptide synthetase [Streptomyces clavuligerus]AXU15945.1 long-chain fatty acid--CoA ligase [Streptomyces clavuligerus]EFG05558.1 AMP-dependent synthetase and ligase [Streptomyces clavuligerus]MBY6306073.1 AMP-binding protein [Streptomyces clavuligerus]QCS08725.1 peptide synthetase [Streptomyces clavuligerus]
MTAPTSDTWPATALIDDAVGTPGAPRVENAAEAFLTAAVAKGPDAPAVRDRYGVWTYADLDAAADSFARVLDGYGIQPGDRVLARVGSVREFTALLYGTWRRGAVLVPINPGMKAFHLRAVLADSEPSLIVAEDAERSVADGLHWPAGVPVTTVGELDLSGPAEAPDARVERDVPADRLALLIYTSGSTSAPKAVACPHAPVTFAARAIAARLGYTPEDVVLTAVPLSFDYGLFQILLSALAGAELLLSGPADHARLLGFARDHGATVVPLVPSLGELLVRLGGRDPRPTRVRLFTNTGAALNAPLIASLREAFPGAAVAPMYGTTECKRITILEPDGDLARPGSVGTALDGTEVLALDDDGRPVPPREIGELCVRGPHVMAGYWRAPEQTALRFRHDPGSGAVTLHTGDYGWLDEDGHVHFQGRRDDLFKRRGSRMSSVEIEAAALDIDGVREAALLVPEEDRDMVLFVTGPLGAEQVLARLGERLEAAKVPDDCRVLDALPLTPNGKTDRKELRRRLVEGTDDD